MKKTTLVAWVSVHPLFLVYFGIDSARAPSPRAHQSSFYPQDPTSILLLCCQLILDENQVWRGSVLDPFWHPFAGLLKEMTQNAHLTKRWIFSLQFSMIFVYYKSTKTPKIM